MATVKKTLTPSEIVDTHRPKRFKYKYYFKDDEFVKQLEEEGFDIMSTDTIKDDAITNMAYNDCEYKYYERDIIKKAKEPSVIEDGIAVSKAMVTKADKKLLNVGIAFFKAETNIEYMVVKLVYEKFDILQLFVKI